jgi:uncharacterized membrane protein
LKNELTQAINQAVAQGKTGDAALQAGIDAVASSVGATKDQLLQQMGKSQDQLKQDFAAQIGGVQQQIGGVQDALTKAINDAKAQGLQGDQVLQSAINKVAGDLGTTKTDLLNRLGTTESQLRTDFSSQIGGVQSQIAGVQDALTKAIEDAKASGLAGDAALQAGINTVANSVGTTKADLLAQMGKTEADLRTDFANQIGGVQSQIGTVQDSLTKAIADAKAQGLQGDAVLQSAINKVAGDLGTTKTDLLNKIGTTEADLKTQFASQIGGVQEQIGTVQDALTKAINDAKAQGLQGDQALQAGIDAVAKSVGTTKADLLTQMGTTEQALRDLYAKGQQQTSADIANVQKSLTDQIASNEAAGLSRDAATQKAIQDVATNLGTTKDLLLAQIGQTAQSLQDEYTTGQLQTQTQIAGVQKSLQDQLAASDEATKAAFAKADAATQQEIANRVAQGQQLQDAIAASQAATTQQITGVQSSLESQLNTQGKAFLDALRQQGVDYNTALKETVDAQNTAFAGYQASTEKALQNLDQSSQDKFNILTTAQQQQALQLAQRTGDLQGSIDAVASTVAANQGQTQEQLDAIRQAQAQAAADQAARDQATADAMAAQNAALTGQITGLQASQTAYQKAQAAAQAKAQNQATQQSALSALAGASPTAPQTSGKSGFLSPLTATFLTAAATPSKFVNPLESLEAIINPRENPKQQPEGSPMASYYNYGSTSSIEDVLGSTPSGQAQNFGGLQYPQFMASGGMATPLMASGGFAGTRHGHYAHGGLSTPLVASGGKMRVDFRHGDAVSGEGDGQSDDIPAMLADGEFVFPADVVAAIGNGSTKAGSDKLYDMMHSIRSHVRSAKPKDLPPEIKSPLDFLSKRRSK